jgi:prepilin-type N-terminal cleavage/methylation domain-containing protein
MHRSYPSNSIWTLNAPRWTSNDVATRRPGFTLVELLIVIAILGILVSLLAWGVNAARISILKKAQSAELANIASAVEAYRNKYGDYPPDGSSWPIVEAHLRKAFPNILITELMLLNPANATNNGYVRNDNDLTGSHPLGGRVFDPAEALVFFLGGFSSDPQRPLTGPGGPFVVNPDNTGAFMYNTQRENSFFDFKNTRLTLANGFSTDETFYNQGVPADLLPVYIGAGPSIQQGGVPITYFDSRTYQLGAEYANFHIPGPVASSPNCARPFLSNDVNAAFAGTPKPQRYANDKTYQIMNAGYDNLYGCQSVASFISNSQLYLFTAPGGTACRLEQNPGPGRGFFFATPTLVKYSLPEFGNLRPVDDNTSNFIDGPTFAESP